MLAHVATLLGIWFEYVSKCDNFNEKSKQTENMVTLGLKVTLGNIAKQGYKLFEAAKFSEAYVEFSTMLTSIQMLCALICIVESFLRGKSH